MAVRFSLPSSGDSEVAVSLSPAWNANTGGPALRARRRQTGSTFSTLTCFVHSVYYICVAQWVSDPLQAQTISGTVSGSIRARESTTAANLYLAVTIRCVSGNGQTVRGTLLSLSADNTELSTSLSSRYWSATVNSVAAQAGDRIVIEVGIYNPDRVSGAGAYIEIGDASSSDLPASDGASGQYCPWVEFSQNLRFQGNLTVQGGLAQTASNVDTGAYDDQPWQQTSYAADGDNGQRAYVTIGEAPQDDSEYLLTYNFAGLQLASDEDPCELAVEYDGYHVRPHALYLTCRGYLAGSGLDTAALDSSVGTYPQGTEAWCSVTDRLNLAITSWARANPANWGVVGRAYSGGYAGETDTFYVDAARASLYAYSPGLKVVVGTGIGTGESVPATARVTQIVQGGTSPFVETGESVGEPRVVRVIKGATAPFIPSGESVPTSGMVEVKMPLSPNTVVASSTVAAGEGAPYILDASGWLAGLIAADSFIGGDLSSPDYRALEGTGAAQGTIIGNVIVVTGISGSAAAVSALASTLDAKDVIKTLDGTIAAAADLTESVMTVPLLAAFPTVSVEIAFVSDLEDAEYVWTDITPYCRSVSTRRGRPNELGAVEPGEATVLLRNVDRRFDPTNTDSPYWPNLLLLRPLRIRATYMGVTYPVFSGYVERWPLQFNAPKAARVEIVAVEASALVGNEDVNPAAWPKEWSGQRIERVLSQLGWTSALWDLDRGDSYVQRTYSEPDQTSPEPALTHIQAAAVGTDCGMFYVSRDGRLTFRSRSSLAAKTSRATFGEAPDELHYVEADLGTDISNIRTRVTITRRNGREQTVESETARARYGIRTLTGDNLMTADVCAHALAQALLERYQTERVQVTKLRLDPRPSPALWQTLLDLELGDLVTVRRRPPGGGPIIEQLSVVEQIEHDFDASGSGRNWASTLSLSPAFRPTVEIPADGVDKPVCESPPTIVGNPVVGAGNYLVLRSHGTWYDPVQEPLTFGYQWVRCQYTVEVDPVDQTETYTITAEEDIPGATLHYYYPVAADENRMLKCRVTGSNSAGQTPADSEPAGPVTLEPPPPPEEPPPPDEGDIGTGGGGGTVGHTFVLNVDTLDDPTALLG